MAYTVTVIFSSPLTEILKPEGNAQKSALAFNTIFAVCSVAAGITLFMYGQSLCGIVAFSSGGFCVVDVFTASIIKYIKSRLLESPAEEVSREIARKIT